MVEDFWAEFVEATGFEGSFEAWAFGGPSDTRLATELALLVRDGPKRATTGRVDEAEPAPVVGDVSMILDGSGAPVCIIRTTEVAVCRFGDVDEAFAWDEGEGDRSLEWWRQAHIRFFDRGGNPVDDDTPMMLEWFELLWPVAVGS